MSAPTETTRRAVLTGLSLAAAAAPAAGAPTPRKTARRPPGGNMPEGFLWGAATAGHQVEGNNVNSDFWLFEHVAPPMLVPDKSGDACDQYHRYPADIAMLAGFGLNAYRFSLEWSRIEPEPGEFSLAELDHYRRLAAECRGHGVTPVVTFNHFTTPRWFAARGGWENPESVDRFARFCEFAVKGVGEFAGLASTMNEPDAGPILKWIGLPPPALAAMSQVQSLAAKACGSDRFSILMFGDQQAMLPNLLAAHRKAYQVIKAGPGDFPVGVSLAIMDDQAVGPNSKRDAKRAEVYEPWLEAASDSDFVGVQTYTRSRLDANGPMRPDAGAEVTQTGDEFYPEALAAAVRYAHEKTGKPVYVTENGVATTDDTRRVEYIRRALAGLKGCIDDGVPVRGYIHWSLLDNYEWGRYLPKFGLVAVDRRTQARAPKPSATYLGAIARANRI